MKICQRNKAAVNFVKFVNTSSWLVVSGGFLTYSILLIIVFCCLFVLFTLQIMKYTFQNKRIHYQNKLNYNFVSLYCLRCFAKFENMAWMVWWIVIRNESICGQWTHLRLGHKFHWCTRSILPCHPNHRSDIWPP